jgi:hypothetical protein
VRLVGVKGVTFARINGRFILAHRLLADLVGPVEGQLRLPHDRVERRHQGVQRLRGRDGRRQDRHQRPFGYAAGTNSMITESVWEGCYCAPVFRPSGATDHIDTLQMYGNGALSRPHDPGFDVLRRR